MSESRIGKEFYDSSDYFEGGTEHLTDLDSPFQRYRVEKVLELYTPGPEERVLDLGCGWGTFCFALAPRVREIVGVDFSEKSIELCRKRLATQELDNVSFVCADARDTGLDAGSFDAVLSADLMEHLYPDDSEAVIAECYRLLKPGGVVALWTPHRGHILEILKNHDLVLKRDVSHVDYKSMARLKRMLTDAGFTVERAYYAESHIPGLRALERALQGVVPWLRRRIAVLGRKPGPGGAASEAG
ncbi:MAG: class I SAM-dependent methyltransferase [Gemmatimonadetes bacterium]|nr:MAG: class I SAM-dependent methyltransferase [Gemmatimonadota bacterium]